MLPFHSIFCPVDFSAHSAQALRHAAALAGLANARLTVAWITDPLLAQAAAVHLLDPHGEQTRADLRAFVAETLSPRAPGLPEPSLDVGTVVVGIDLGPDSKALAAFGANLATALKATQVFVHVVAPHSAPALWQPAVEAHQKSAVGDAREELSRLAAGTGDGTAEAVVSAGNPAEEIAALAATRHAGLIVMGLMNQTGILGARPGSIAYRVLVLMPIPVLVVPPAAVKADA